MELIRKNIHMEQTKGQANSQMTLEEDKNISDSKPDVAHILADKGSVMVEEIRPAQDAVVLKGKLRYEVLYLADGVAQVCSVSGEIPFDEKIRVEGAESTDNFHCRGELEHINVGLINSRKISLRALVNLSVQVEELYSKELIEDIREAPNVEIKKESLEESFLRVQKNDIFRVKEELELPGSLPSIVEPLWNQGHLGKIEIRPLEDNIGIKGEIQMFFLYEGEGEDRPIRYYEAAIPFSGNLECAGSREEMLGNIVPEVSSWNVNVKPDYDGEDRILEAEMVLALPIRLLETESTEMVTDVYGTREQIEPVFDTMECRRFLGKTTGKCKIAENLKNRPSEPRISQIFHCEGEVSIEEVEKTEQGLNVIGVLPVNVFYMTGEDTMPFYSKQSEIPFQYLLETGELEADTQWTITPTMEQCSGILLDGENMEVKATVLLEAMLWKRWNQPMMTGLKVEELDAETVGKMPGMVVYVAEEGENIWNVGKQYLTSMESIRSLNQLERDELQRGQKILVVKEVV